MFPSTVPLLVLALNAALDTGKYDHITVDEVAGHIERGTVFAFLEAHVPDARELPRAEDREEISETWYQLWAAYGVGEARRKWGVANRGLCLLVAWTNEIVNSGTHGGWRYQLVHRPPASPGAGAPGAGG